MKYRRLSESQLRVLNLLMDGLEVRRMRIFTKKGQKLIRVYFVPGEEVEGVVRFNLTCRSLIAMKLVEFLNTKMILTDTGRYHVTYHRS